MSRGNRTILVDDALTLFSELVELPQRNHLRGCKVKAAKTGRDVVEVGCQPLLVAQKSISSEGLHEPLRRGFPEGVVEGS